MSDTIGWWERLGGPNAVSLPAWWLTLPGGLVATFAFIPRGAPVPVAEWVLLGLAAHVVNGAVLWAAWRTYLSPRPRPSRPWATVATFLIAGFLRGLFAWAAATWWGLPGAGTAVGRSVGSALSVLVWFSLATLVVDASRRHRATMGRLDEAMVRERELAERSVVIVRDYRSGLCARTEALVTQELAQAAALGEDPAQAAAWLHHTVDEVIRPLAHELEQRTLGEEELVLGAERLREPPRVPVREYLVGVVTDRPFSPLATAAVLAATPVSVAVTVLGMLLGGVVLVGTALWIGLALLAARRGLAGRLSRWAVPVRAMVVLAVWSTVVVAQVLLLAGLVRRSGVRPDTWLVSTRIDPTAASLGIVAVATALALVTLAAEGAVEGQRTRAELTLQEALAAAEWTAARLRQQAWSEQRRFGRTLHGEVQARIVSLAQRLEDVAADQAPAAIAAVAQQIRDTLTQDPVDSWRRGLADIEAVWQGAIDLSLDVDEDASRALDGDPVAGRAVVAVVGEGVTNAVRHGNADTVDVCVRTRPRAVEVVVVDDGAPPSGEEAQGLGSRLLEAACLDWARTREPATTLRARVACEPTATGVAANEAVPA